eukprot:CAMPEP_0185720080 /NCGR_PEP_ID=MMETSP1164-20130828/49935_1 /TAXON_ID=1104430 /ORGANISM="Chrysoreinhardia sp, Strain CCMP2950" /LENGTH=280 /DNA_ID=CAMNT_0028387743 /DNA_START=55 /DNA_END=897 /DNA_ORIENTATION=-
MAPRLAIAALCAVPALGFLAPSPAPAATVAMRGAKEDLIKLQTNNPSAQGWEGIWDPLGCADFDFWGIGNEATIGYLRHAEIKHGRVAMAGFLGFCVQSLPLVKGPHPILPYKGYVPDVTPQEQWDNIPLVGKLQILTLVGMLESYGEGAGSPEGYVHYTKGGQPGYYPPIKGKGLGQIQLDLYDPLGWFPELSPAEKERKLYAELNNGRLAMIGLFSLLSESAVPGSNPQLKFLALEIPKYDGKLMTFDSSLYSPFIEQFGYVLAACALVQQIQLRRNK